MDILKDNIRISINGDDSELRESMKAHGWVGEFPALVDENGIVLVGHRRLKIAAELGITPIIKKLMIGAGDEADAQRLRLAIVSNIGFKPMTKEDRQRIAKYLYGDREWTMQRIADALNTSKQRISEDLANCPDSGQSKPAKTASNPKGAGRPKGQPKRHGGKPVRHPKTDEVLELVKEGKLTQQEIAAQLGITHDQVYRIEKKNAQETKTEKLSDLKTENFFLRKENEGMKIEIRKLKEAAARPPRPQLDAESEASRTIRALRTKLANLERKLKTLILYRDVKMTPEVYRTIVKALHPDRSPEAGERERAMMLFNDLFSGISE
jgi:ParB-like chromosome segregation protein Spo0J